MLVLVPTVERGLRLVRCWSTLTDGMSPEIESTGGFDSQGDTKPSSSWYWRWPSLLRMSNPRVDLPDPDSPVRTMSWFLGSERLTFFRLCSRAPRMVI
jgi:hypothetical protein